MKGIVSIILASFVSVALCSDSNAGPDTVVPAGTSSEVPVVISPPQPPTKVEEEHSDVEKATDKVDGVTAVVDKDLEQVAALFPTGMFDTTLAMSTISNIQNLGGNVVTQVKEVVDFVSHVSQMWKTNRAQSIMDTAEFAISMISQGKQDATQVRTILGQLKAIDENAKTMLKYADKNKATIVNTLVTRLEQALVAEAISAATSAAADETKDGETKDGETKDGESKAAEIKEVATVAVKVADEVITGKSVDPAKVQHQVESLVTFMSHVSMAIDEVLKTGRTLDGVKTAVVTDCSTCFGSSKKNKK